MLRSSGVVVGDHHSAFMLRLDTAADRLITIKMLGELDKDLVNQHLKFVVDPREAEVEVGQSPQLGFWLLHGVKFGSFCATWWDRYRSLITVYESLFVAWPDSNFACHEEVAGVREFFIRSN